VRRDGGRCYPDLQSIPGGVDGAVIITRLGHACMRWFMKLTGGLPT
jgi:hypothetical protein